MSHPFPPPLRGGGDPDGDWEPDDMLTPRQLVDKYIPISTPQPIQHAEGCMDAIRPCVHCRRNYR